jgi:membrane glycosyltransferase
MISPFHVFNGTSQAELQVSKHMMMSATSGELTLFVMPQNICRKLATKWHWRQRLSATIVLMLHWATLNQPQNKKDYLGTFISLPLNLHQWQRIIIMVTSTAVDVAAAYGMEEAIVQVSGSSLQNCILIMYFQLFVIQVIYCTYIWQERLCVTCLTDKNVAVNIR